MLHRACEILRQLECLPLKQLKKLVLPGTLNSSSILRDSWENPTLRLINYAPPIVDASDLDHNRVKRLLFLQAFGVFTTP